MSSVPDRINATINRADDLLRERLRREKAALEREDAERADAAREQAIADSWRCREIAELYDDSFRFVRRLDAEPLNGERPGRYRRRLFDSCGVNCRATTISQIFAPTNFPPGRRL